MDLDIWLGECRIARTESRDRGRKVRIRYADDVMSRYAAEVPLLSCSLPTPGPSASANALAFLEGLLPEGRAREAAAAQVRGVRLVAGAPEVPADVLALLAEFGRECAGAVVTLPAGHDPPGKGRFVPLDEGLLATIIRDLPRHAWERPEPGSSKSLAGRATDCHVWTERMGEGVVLVTQRYDRLSQGERIVRLHQEDMCQAAGARLSRKYAMGRPGAWMSRILREFSDSSRQQNTELFKQIAFRAVIGDEDGHGKNHSLLLNDGAVPLALYDSVCSLVYLELTGNMGVPIVGARNLSEVDRAAMLDEAGAMGGSPRWGQALWATKWGACLPAERLFGPASSLAS